MHDSEQSGHWFPGSRVAVLLVHGLTGTPKEMLSVAKRLNKYGFTVFCPVLAGHCGSEEDLLATRWQDWAHSVENALSQLAEQADVVFVGGLSAGAVLSLYLADRHPDRHDFQKWYHDYSPWRRYAETGRQCIFCW